MKDIDFAQAETVIERIAEIAGPFAQQAGVGAMEIAGLLVSYLAKHPRDIEPCLRFGIFELPEDWISLGALTWTAKNGKVVAPEFARRARQIKKLASMPGRDPA